MTKSRHTESMPHPGHKIHIPLPEDEALRLALQVKPTKDMPRPGATGKKVAPPSKLLNVPKSAVAPVKKTTPAKPRKDHTRS